MMVQSIKIFLSISQYQPETILYYLSPLNNITFSAEKGKGDVHEQAHLSWQQLQKSTAWSWSGLASALGSGGKGNKQEQGQFCH